MNDPPGTVGIHARIADALERLGTLARARQTKGSWAADLSPLQARALVLLRRRGDLRVGEVADGLMVTYGTVSVALSALEAKGLVAKHQDPDEHRAVRVALTRRGRTLADRAGAWTAVALEPALAALSAAESAALLATLLKLILMLEQTGALAAARMCVSCRHFVPHGGAAGRPHFCRLLGTPIGDAELRVDCADHERADPDQLAAAAQDFHPLR